MTTLASAVAIGDNQLIIDAPLAQGLIPGWVKIDSELLKVGGQHFRTGTTLVLSDPATATHNNGATVTYAGNPYDADFLAATGVSGAGGVTVDNEDTAEEVALIRAPGADLSTPGEATLGANADVLSLQDQGGGVGLTLSEINDDNVLFVNNQIGTVVAVDGAKGFHAENSDGDLSYLRITPAGMFMLTLPTANPAVAGQLWNDAGTLKVSAG